ncbi:DUF1559 domain-containing protein [Blastopirellula sp. J2-11]|uniref:DUF1559 domain-containing protein n=1 Tax=Blastopirellula sp. J2-11 TaxID=2943192 RepID=UPI0021C6E1BC|nr:DUF1559 domain-containing protein [Blastopirellula sp. J2-11]UUO04568.1 DUF1559 domain-containing protein [Blastopirellula sp. J2-11]
MKSKQRSTALRFAAVLRTGFSLVDLIVACSLIAILVAIFLPTIQVATEEANLKTCTNHIRLLSNSFHGYADARKAFPPRRTGFGGKMAYGGWGSQILPHLQPALNDQYDHDFDFYDPKNKEVVETQVSEFLCPSAPHDRKMTISASASAGSRNADRATVFTVDAGPNDFISSNGLFMPDAGYGANWPSELRGNDHQSMTDNDPLPFRLITDGMTNTFLIIEKAGLPESWRVGKKTSDTAPIGGENSRGSWAGFGSIAFMVFDRETGTVRGKGDSNDCAVNCNNYFGIYGFHPQGANVLFCDGSVRFVTPKLDGLIYGRLTTRDDGQAIDLAAF